MDSTKILLTNGIKSIIFDGEDHFQKSITEALALKLNNSFQVVRKSFSSKLFEESFETSQSSELTEFLSFCDNFIPGVHSFQDGSVLNITENDLNVLKNLFESLNIENRKKMIQEIFKDKNTFRQHVEFGNSSKGLL